MTPFRVFFFALAAALFVFAALDAQAQDGPIAIETEALALNRTDAAEVETGRLRYLGGLVLRSGEPRVGGISGLRWLGEGNRFLAVTDQGDWLRFDTVEEAGRLTGLADPVIGRLTDERGAPLIAKPLADAEALTLGRADGRPNRAHIWFEGSHRGTAYDLSPDGLVGAYRRDLPLGTWTEKLPRNGGLEAVAGTANGLFLIPEDLRAEDGRIEARRRWKDGDRVRDEVIRFDLPEPFRPTDAHALPGGDILLLSRHFSPLEGVSARLDRLHFRAAEGGGVGRFDRTAIAVLKPPLSVDNMEGLAVRFSGDRTLIYLVSDDNFNLVQRTLLMKFELLPSRKPVPKDASAAVKSRD